MKRALLALAAAGFAALSFSAAHAATAAEEAAFISAYKTAFAAKDANGLQALLNTDGADPMALQFYGQVMTAQFADGTLTSIELQDLTAEDKKKAATPQDGPNGKFVLVPKPYKKLVLKIDSNNDSGNSTSTSTVFVAEVNGKLIIATPAPAK